MLAEVVFVNLTTGGVRPFPKVVSTRAPLSNVPDGADDREHRVAGLHTPLRKRCWITGQGGVNCLLCYNRGGRNLPAREPLCRTGAHHRHQWT